MSGTHDDNDDRIDMVDRDVNNNNDEDLEVYEDAEDQL